jgi:hypothetical protein
MRVATPAVAKHLLVARFEFDAGARPKRDASALVSAQTRHSGGSGPDAREMTEGGFCAGALGARVGRQADELGALFPEAPGEVVVLGLVAGGNHLLVFDVLPGEGSGVV